jgi:quercetin dioxygenase-like cupin family protein
MTPLSPSRASLLGALALAAMIAAPSIAFAGSCPADKMGTDVRPPDTTAAKAVTDTVLTTMDLSQEPAHIEGRLFRLRRLVVQPGGVVPWHSHGDRPSLIYIVSGDVYEYASTCSVPILHKAGEATPETHSTSHWWKNTGKVPVVILSADLFPQKGDAHMM